MRTPDARPGERGKFDRSVSNAYESSRVLRRYQAIPEREAEALAWGYGLPPADHLTACRAIWWRLRRLGVPLPFEHRIILIAGGRDG